MLTFLYYRSISNVLTGSSDTIARRFNQGGSENYQLLSKSRQNTSKTKNKNTVNFYRIIFPCLH